MKPKNSDQRDALLCLVLFTLFSISISGHEYYILPPDLKLLYAMLRGGVIVSIFIFLCLLYRRPHNQPILFSLGLLFCAYSAVGEYFADLYLFCFLQFMFVYAFLLRPKRLIFTSICAFGWLPILYLIHLKDTGVLTHTRPVVLADFFSIMVFFVVFFIILFEGYSKKRRNEIEYRDKFALIGENTNIIAHNIKSILNTQFILVYGLKSSLENPPEELSILENNLNYTKKYLNQLNTLSRNEVTEVQLLDSVEMVNNILKIPSSCVALQGENHHIHTNKQDFETILLNILSNGQKAIRGEEKIEIRTAENTIKIIAPLVKNYEKGSGIGMEISRNLCRKNKISLLEEKSNESYIVTLSFS